MKTTAITLFVLLFLSLIGNYLQWHYARLAQRDRNQEAKEFRSQSKELLIRVAHRDSAMAVLFDQREKDSVSHAKNQSALKARLNALRARVSGPAVVQDTIIVFQDSLIADLELERDTLYIRDNAMVDSLQKSNFELKELFTGQLKESIRLQNQVDREKRKKFTVGPAVGVDYQGKPTVSFGVTYKLFSF